MNFFFNQNKHAKNKLALVLMVFLFIVLSLNYDSLLAEKKVNLNQQKNEIISIDEGRFFRSLDIGARASQLLLPQGVSSGAMLFQNIRSNLVFKYGDLQDSFAVRAYPGRIHLLEKADACCKGYVSDSPRDRLTIKLKSLVNSDSSQKIDSINVYGCSESFLFKEVLTLKGKELKPTSDKNLAQGLLGGVNNPFAEEKYSLVKYLLSYRGYKVIEITQVTSENKKLMDIRLFTYLTYQIIDMKAPSYRKITYRLPVLRAVLPKIVIGDSTFTFRRLSTSSEQEYTVEIKDEGHALPEELYVINAQVVTKEEFLLILNSNVYNTMSSLVKTWFVNGIVVDTFLPKTEITTTVTDTVFLQELKELRVFLNQNTPDSLDKIRLKLNEYIKAIEDGVIVVNDKRP